MNSYIEIHENDPDPIQSVVEDRHHEGQVENKRDRVLKEVHYSVEGAAVYTPRAGGDDDDVGTQVEHKDETTDPEEQPGPHACRFPKTGSHVGRLTRFCAQESPFLSYFLRPST